MEAFRLVANFISRVDLNTRPRNEILSRSQIKRIGQRLAAEIYETKGASDTTRDPWLDSARAVLDGATDKIFLRQLQKGFDRELYAAQAVVEILQDVRANGGLVSKWGRWCLELDRCSDLKNVAAVLAEICDALPDIGDRHYLKVEVLKDLAALPGPCKVHRRPGAGLTAFG